MMDFIQWGGVDMLEKTMRMHAKDEFLVSTLPKLIKIILGMYNVFMYDFTCLSAFATIFAAIT